MRPAVTALLIAPLWIAACQQSPPPQPPVPVTASQRAVSFDEVRAWGHLEALTSIGPRVAGSDGAARARRYILDELERLGLELIEQRVMMQLGADGEQLEVRNVAAIVPGASTDVFLLAAPYDTRLQPSFSFVGANDGGSGAAVLLELARVLAAAPLPYTTALVFLDGEARRTVESAEGVTAEVRHLGSKGLARRLKQQDVLDSVRLALVMNRVCDPDLRIARDSFSHRNYREWYWRAGRRLGHDTVFPRAAGYEATGAGHEALSAGGVRRVLAVVDTSFGGDEPPGPFADSEDDDLDHCSEESLGIVGAVTLEALGDISERLARIDRFADAPLEAARAMQLESLKEPPDPPVEPETPEEQTAETPAQAAGSAEQAADANGPAGPPEESAAAESELAADAPLPGVDVPAPVVDVPAVLDVPEAVADAPAPEATPEAPVAGPAPELPAPAAEEPP